MKAWSGKDINIHNNKKDGYIEIYKDNKYIERIWNTSHGSITRAKERIDYIIKTHYLE